MSSPPEDVLELLVEAPEVGKRLRAGRGTVYGDPRENHKGIAAMWAVLLQPHAEAISRGEPIPEWTVSLLMAALKLDRMRLAYHRDNYDDALLYLSFTERWQRDWKAPVDGRAYALANAHPSGAPLRIYVAGPFTGGPCAWGMDCTCFSKTDCVAQRNLNIHEAKAVTKLLMALGHQVHCPHAATEFLHGEFDNERFMELDLGIIERWANALYFIGPSPGANRERELAVKLGLPVFTHLDQVPNLGASKAAAA